MLFSCGHEISSDDSYEVLSGGLNVFSNGFIQCDIHYFYTFLNNYRTPMTPPAGGAPVEVSVILPTLDEEKTIGDCIQKIRAVFRSNNLIGEIIIATVGAIICILVWQRMR